MSESDYNDLQEASDPNTDRLQEIASNSSGGRRKSTRLAERTGPPTDEADLLISQLQDQGIMPAPGLLPSQLRELADCASQQPGPSSHPEDDPTIPGDFSGAPVRGRKRARKAASSKKPAAKISHTATRSYVSAPTSAPANILTTTLQSPGQHFTQHWQPAGETLRTPLMQLHTLLTSASRRSP